MRFPERSVYLPPGFGLLFAAFGWEPVTDRYSPAHCHYGTSLFAKACQPLCELVHVAHLLSVHPLLWFLLYSWGMDGKRLRYHD